jgi:hypothetical protein
MQPTELSGIWQVQRIYGQPIDLQAVTLLMRFTADGRLVIDHEGELFRGRPDVRGRYRLDNALLTTQVEGGEGCAPGEGATWRVAKTSAGGLSLAWVDGTCPNDGQDDVWILRRLLDEAGFP